MGRPKPEDAGLVCFIVRRSDEIDALADVETDNDEDETRGL